MSTSYCTKERRRFSDLENLVLEVNTWGMDVLLGYFGPSFTATLPFAQLVTLEILELLVFFCIINF